MSVPHVEFLGKEDLEALRIALCVALDRIQVWPWRTHWRTMELRVCEALGVDPPEREDS